MKKALIITASALVAALAVTAGATAGRPHHQRSVVGLERTVRRLHKQLRRARHQRDVAGRRLENTRAALEARLAKAEHHTAMLQEQLSQAHADAAALQAKLDAIPTPLTIAVADVHREVIYAQGGRTLPLDPQLIAEAAMDYTYGHVRSAAYGYLEQVYHEGPWGPHMAWIGYYSDVNTILGAQMGICVHHERVFAHIVEGFGLQVRDVGFDYHEPNGTPNAHSTAEVYYNGSWHWFDPTFGVLFKDDSGNVLSIADARAGLGQQVKDAAGFQNLLSPDATWFETDPATYVSYHPQLN